MLIGIRLDGLGLADLGPRAPKVLLALKDPTSLGVVRFWVGVFKLSRKRLRLLAKKCDFGGNEAPLGAEAF
jgi:hypothetical protein